MNVVRIERVAIVQGSSIQYVGEEMAGAGEEATRAVQYLLLCVLEDLLHSLMGTNGSTGSGSLWRCDKHFR